MLELDEHGFAMRETPRPNSADLPGDPKAELVSVGNDGDGGCDGTTSVAAVQQEQGHGKGARRPQPCPLESGGVDGEGVDVGVDVDDTTSPALNAYMDYLMISKIEMANDFDETKDVHMVCTNTLFLFRIFFVSYLSISFFKFVLVEIRGRTTQR